MKISKSDTDLTPDGNNTFEKGNSKRLSKKENEKLHTSVERGIFFNQESNTRYSSNSGGDVNEG